LPWPRCRLLPPRNTPTASKGSNGGQLEDVAGVHAELLTSGNTITINVFDEGNKPDATKGFAASALVARGSERETVARGGVEGRCEKAGRGGSHHGHAAHGSG
jgi:hypothetical protein